MITAIVAHYWNREGNLPLIVEALRGGTMVPKEIIIWDNTNHVGPLKGAIVIRSEKAYGCQSDLPVAYFATTPYVFFQDNDLTVKPNTLEGMYRWIGQFGPVVLAEAPMQGGQRG